MMNFDKPVFLLQNNYFDRIGRLVQPCLDFCRDHGHDFVDRSITDEFDPDALGVDWNAYPGVIVYGSVGWVKRCSKSSLAPWTFYEAEAFSSTKWVPILGDEALNGDGCVMTVAEVRERLAMGERLHLRPNREDKAFVGAVYDHSTWAVMEEKRRVEQQSPVRADLECWASPLKEIRAEHRCWFIGGEFVEVSTYRKDGVSHIERYPDLALLREGMRLAEMYLPMGSVVMDIAETADGFKVIEFNPVTSSGFYAADVEVIFGSWSDMICRGRMVPDIAL